MAFRFYWFKLISELISELSSTVDKLLIQANQYQGHQAYPGAANAVRAQTLTPALSWRNGCTGAHVRWHLLCTRHVLGLFHQLIHLILKLTTLNLWGSKLKESQPRTKVREQPVPRWD